MVAGGHVWLGTGAGTVAIFSVEAGVEDPAAAITELARRAGEVKAISQRRQWRASMAGAGLVHTAEQLGEGPGEGPGEETEEEKSEPKPHYHSQERSQEFRRKTQFGRTLRRDKNRSLPRRQSEQMVYQLKFAANRQVVSQNTEAVRVLLPLRWVWSWLECVCVRADFSLSLSCRQGSTPGVVSCVHSLQEHEKAVQVWQCDARKPPDSVSACASLEIEQTG